MPPLQNGAGDSPKNGRHCAVRTSFLEKAQKIKMALDRKRQSGIIRRSLLEF
jgi:hypothetical protein